MRLVHADELQELAECLGTLRAPTKPSEAAAEQRHVARDQQALYDAYRFAISVDCQSQAPLACTSLDRRCLRQAVDSLEQAPPETRICMLCAQRLPFVKGSKADIRFGQELQPTETGEVFFLGQSSAATAATLGRDVFVARYVEETAGTRRESMLQDLQDWTCTLTFRESRVEIICCPEDKECRAGCTSAKACSQCWLPICRQCRTAMGAGQMPQHALANDLVVYYAPRELYEERVTMMELVCASPCMTSLICFSLEKKYRNRRTLDERAHMQRHRQGARGNATTFLLDWEQLLQQFRAYEQNVAPRDGALLPRAGEDLQKFVSIVLKTKDEELDGTNLAKLIHQARVRRRVVVRLIENACARGHPAFGRIDLPGMRKRAQDLLPEDGVPPEVIAVLPSSEKDPPVEKQKVAAPQAAPATVEEAAVELSLRRPNAVVLEKSCVEVMDYEAQQVAAVQALADVAEEDLLQQNSEQEDGPAPEQDVVSSNQPIDQFAPWYFGVAFAYLFQYCTAMPDRTPILNPLGPTP